VCENASNIGWVLCDAQLILAPPSPVWLNIERIPIRKEPAAVSSRTQQTQTRSLTRTAAGKGININHISIATGGSRAFHTCSNHGRSQPLTFEHYFTSCLHVKGEITALEVCNGRFNCVK
jgi:hypothetical protein